MKIKKILAVILALSLSGMLAACGAGNTSSSVPSASSQSAVQSASSSTAVTGSGTATLVVYFSLPETSDPNNMTQEEENSAIVVNGEVLGNTQYVAMLIADNTGADMFRIEAAEPYPLDHSTLVDQASAEKASAARPALAALPENLDLYDIIFLGYPNWWGDMPMILYTFLESVDLSGKTIIPFNTHGGSGFSNTISTIASLQPNATVVQNGYSISRNNMEDAPDGVKNWLDGLEF